MVSAGDVHFILFPVAPVCKIAAAPDDFAPCVYLCHCFGTHSGRTFILKNELISFFQTEPAVSGLPVCNGQFKFPVFCTPFPHDKAFLSKISIYICERSHLQYMLRICRHFLTSETIYQLKRVSASAAYNGGRQMNALTSIAHSEMGRKKFLHCFLQTAGRLRAAVF